MSLHDVRGFVFDVDGTLVQRAGVEVRPLSGAAEALAAIRASGRPFVLFTNGSHIPPAGFARELREAGLAVDDDEVLTPLDSVQTYLAGTSSQAVLTFATDSARAYLEGVGVAVVDGGEDHVDAVFVAHPQEIGFEQLELAARAVISGARLLTGSYVSAYAGANGPILSRGAMVTAALAKASGKRPTVVGKPSRAAVRAIRERLGLPPEEIAVVGDDLHLDIALGRLGGSRTVLVRTGISASLDLDRVPESHRPDLTVDGVADLVTRL